MRTLDLLYSVVGSPTEKSGNANSKSRTIKLKRETQRGKSDETVDRRLTGK